MLFANGVSTFFMNDRSTLINGPRKFMNLPSSLLIFLVVSFNKIPLFSQVLITFIMSFVSLSLSVIPEPVIFLYFQKPCWENNNFILADDSFAKASQNLKTCV